MIDEIDKINLHYVVINWPIIEWDDIKPEFFQWIADEDEPIRGSWHQLYPDTTLDWMDLFGSKLST